MRLPKARRTQLTIRELPDETLIYDHATNKAHCLNRTAALVWHSCDGKMTVRELAGLLQRELGVMSAEPLIHLTLEKLARRKLLRQLAVAALPVIMTMVAPRANAAASTPTAGGVCPPGQTMCSGVCVNLQTSQTNCGACGEACGTTQSCVAGQCGQPPNP
jgi:Stigma-specific protein, Stig1/Coenzyme PQQ synthesis protein D (PqqD)